MVRIVNGSIVRDDIEAAEPAAQNQSNESSSTSSAMDRTAKFFGKEIKVWKVLLGIFAAFMLFGFSGLLIGAAVAGIGTVYKPSESQSSSGDSTGSKKGRGVKTIRDLPQAPKSG